MCEHLNSNRHLYRRRPWHPTPVLLPGKSNGWRSLVGCSPWGHDELDTTEWFTFTFHFHAFEKEMATRSSVLAWSIPGKGEPGGLPSMGSHRVGHDWSDLATAAASTEIGMKYWKKCWLAEWRITTQKKLNSDLVLHLRVSSPLNTHRKIKLT